MKLSGEQMQVLLAEDDAADIELVKTLFSISSFAPKLNVVRDGFELTEYLRDRKENKVLRLPDIILLDLNMPKKSGREALREIKSDEALRTIPIIVFSSSDSVSDVSSSYDLNANCYVKKPADLQKMRDVIEAIENFWFNCVTLP